MRTRIRQGDAGLVKIWSCTSRVFIPISLRRFPPVAKGGGRGGCPGTTSHKVFPMLAPSQSFRIPLARREESFSISKAPASPPPYPPFARGGKQSLARDVIPSRATKTRVSKPSLQLGQHQLFTGPVRGWHAGKLVLTALRSRLLCWGHPHSFNYGWPFCVHGWPFCVDLCLRRGQPAHPPPIGRSGFAAGWGELPGWVERTGRGPAVGRFWL